MEDKSWTMSDETFVLPGSSGIDIHISHVTLWPWKRETWTSNIWFQFWEDQHNEGSQTRFKTSTNSAEDYFYEICYYYHSWNMLFCFCSTFKFQRENVDKLDGVLEKLCYVLPWCSSMGPLGEVRGWSPPVPRYLTRFNKGRKFSSFMAWISYKLKHFLFYFDQTSASPTSMTTPTSTTGWSPPLPRYMTHYKKGRQFFP